MVEKERIPPTKSIILRNSPTDWLLRRDSKGDTIPTKVPPIVHEVLRSPGQPLSSSVRAFMEPRLGHDFSQVRVHTDTQAVVSAQAVNALAYAVGHHVVFGNGQYQPDTSEGRHLLAHELAHVVQQENRSTQSTLQRWSATVHADLTRQAITGAMNTFSDFQLDDTALQMLAFFAGDMDSQGEEILFNAIGAFVGNQIATDVVVGNTASESKEDDASYHHRKLVQHYRVNTEHAFNHGEGGLYSIPEEQAEPLNQAHQGRYELQANQTFQSIRRAFSSIQESELAKPALRQCVLTQLGDALHIAQDRGAHREGGIGLGHDNLGINPDSPTANRIGYRKAQDLTKSAVERNRAILSLLLDRKFMRKHIAVQSIEEQSIQPQRKIDSSSGLVIGQIDDEYEREADRVATEVMNISVPVNRA